MTLGRPALAAFAALALLALSAAGCSSERVITVQNSSSTELRVFVEIPNGGVSSVSPAPGSSAAVVAGDVGAYHAFAVLDAEWLDSIRFRRDFLTRQLADREVRRRLSAEQLRQVSDQVNELTREIERATERPSENGGGCSGTITDEDGSGHIDITDNSAGGFPAYLLVCQ